MNDSIKLLFEFVGFTISLFAAYWVWQDANRLKRNGAKVTPALWALLVFIIWLVSLPLYWLLRRTAWRTYLSPSPEEEHPAA